MKFSDLLKERRKELGISRKEAADCLGWTPMYYSRYENDKLLPTERNINKFSVFLNIPKKSLNIYYGGNKNELEKK